MNLYFLVEGSRTEYAFYPKLIKFVFGELLTKVDHVDQIKNNNFFVLSREGWPSLYDEKLLPSIEDINQYSKCDYLFICIDSEEFSVADKKLELEDYLKKFKEEYKVELNDNCKIILVVQNICIETWFLGNRKIYKNNPSTKLLKSFQTFYNVKDEDPELMGKLPRFNTKAQFHSKYLKEALLERNINYSKRLPPELYHKTYLTELINRVKEDSHINSFGELIKVLFSIKREIENAA